MRCLGGLGSGFVMGFLGFLLGRDRGRPTRRFDLKFPLRGRLALFAVSHQTEGCHTQNKGGGNRLCLCLLSSDH
jgi:hypothetical protein